MVDGSEDMCSTGYVILWDDSISQHDLLSKDMFV